MSKFKNTQKDLSKNSNEERIPLESPKGIPKRPYSKLTRELSEEDLSNPPVQKFLLGEIDRLEERIQQLEDFEKQFHENDKERAVLEEKLKTSNAYEILYSFCLAFGSGLIGLTPTFEFADKGWILFVLGVILLFCGILTKYKK